MTPRCQQSRRVHQPHENAPHQGATHALCPQRWQVFRTQRGLVFVPAQEAMPVRALNEYRTSADDDAVLVRQQQLAWHGYRCVPLARWLMTNHQR